MQHVTRDHLTQTRGKQIVAILKLCTAQERGS